MATEQAGESIGTEAHCASTGDGEGTGSPALSGTANSKGAPCQSYEVVLGLCESEKGWGISE